MADSRSGPDPEDAVAVPDDAVAVPDDALMAALPESLPEGKSAAPQGQWTLIWREFRRHPRAVISAAVIFLLVALSVFAPFVANDRPIVYRGVDRFAYADAWRTLRTILAIAAAPQAPSAAAATDAAENFDHAAIARSLLRTMSQAATDDDAQALREFGERIDELLRRPADATRGAELNAARDELLRIFSIDAVELPVAWHWPVFASLHWLDVFFMAFVSLVATWIGWRRIVRAVVPAEPASRQTVAQWSVLIGLPLVGAGLWAAIVPSRVDRTDYYAGVSLAGARIAAESPVAYDWVLWPPVPYGYERYDLDALYAPSAFWRTAATEDAPQDGAAEESGRRESSAKEHAQLGGAAHRIHWLGTDSIGRDVLARMIWGGRVSLAVGVVAVSIYVMIGVIVGAIAGYFRGWSDILISRAIEIVIVFPSFFLILAIVAFIGPSIFNIMIVIGLTGWTGIARLIRSEFLRLGEQEFVVAGKALGYSPARIIFRHVLPNAIAPVLVAATFGVAGAILTESALSFLGFGITVPQPSWGGILSAGRDAMMRAPWLIYFPGFAIFVTITAYNLVGEALRDAADPKLRGQHVR
ncbi:MAG: ABC transporter permease [Planctomycetaceae bacterium]